MTIVDARNAGWRDTAEEGGVAWTGGRVAPNGSESFGLLVDAPDEKGVHEFVAVQRYSDGHKSRWVLDVNVTRTPGQNLVGAAIVGLVGVVLVLAFVVLRTKQSRSPRDGTTST